MMKTMKILRYTEFLNNEEINEGFIKNAALVFALATSSIQGHSQVPNNTTIEYRTNSVKINQIFSESIKVFDEMNQCLKANFNGKESWKITDFIIDKIGGKINLSLERKKDKDGFNLFVISCNEKGKPRESTDNILRKNTKSKILYSENIKVNNIYYECHLIGLNIDSPEMYEKNPLVDNKSYEAIYKFETTKGLVKKVGNEYVAYGFSKGYDVHQNDEVIKSHIKNTIGLKTWFKIPPKFRMQIFSYMFNSDSDDKDKFRWLAGLAQSLDASQFSDRGSIMNNPDARDKAINYIKGLSESDFESHYDEYLKVLKSQYNSLTTKYWYDYYQAAKKLSWSIRPTELDNYYAN